MALLMRRAVLLAKTETTYGVDSTPTGAANAILCRNMSITPIAQDLVQRDVIRPFLGNDENIVAGNHVECDFEIEMAGAGAAGTVPAYGPLLLACGFSATTQATTSVTYTPVSTAFSSVTLIYNVDGVSHKITGARGSVSLEMNAKGIPVCKFKFSGLYNAVTDTAITGATYAAFIKPVAVNKDNTTMATLFGTSLILQSANIDIANTIVYRNLVGLESVLLTDRAPVGSLQFEETTVAAFDVWSHIKNGTTGALSLTHGTTAGNIVQISCPSVQITQPQLSDMDGISMLQVSTLMLPSAAGGNDEVSIIVR